MIPLFDYYMVRVTRTEEPARLIGLVERLGTGEKRSFTTGEQLLDHVVAWAGSDSNVPARPEGGETNPRHSTSHEKHPRNAFRS